MSDYISELRRDLVEAAERQAHAGRAIRVARPLHPRAWSPSALAGATAIAIALIAVVVTLTTLAPPPKPSDAKIVATVRVGGQPRDAVLAGGSLWIADFEGRVLRFDPATRRVLARIRVGGNAVAVAADGDVVWVMSNSSPDGSRSYLFKLDARSGKRLARGPVDGSGGRVEAGAGGLWLVRDRDTGDLERIDPDSFERTASVRLGGATTESLSGGLSVSGRSVWTRQFDSVLEIDGGSGRVVSRVRTGLQPLQFDTQRSLLADRDGVWVVGPTEGVLARIERGRVTRRITVGTTADYVARVGSSIWVTASRGGDDGVELVRVDPDEGKVVQRLRFGYDEPRTLVPVGEDFWVITSSGRATLVSPG
jgi:sugar lactone lactonase YvrE